VPRDMCSITTTVSTGEGETRQDPTKMCADVQHARDDAAHKQHRVYAMGGTHASKRGHRPHTSIKRCALKEKSAAGAGKNVGVLVACERTAVHQCGSVCASPSSSGPAISILDAESTRLSSTRSPHRRQHEPLVRVCPDAQGQRQHTHCNGSNSPCVRGRKRSDVRN
jgi:hypothetical protein